MHVEVIVRRSGTFSGHSVYVRGVCRRLLQNFFCALPRNVNFTLWQSLKTGQVRHACSCAIKTGPFAAAETAVISTAVASSAEIWRCYSDCRCIGRATERPTGPAWSNRVLQDRAPPPPTNKALRCGHEATAPGRPARSSRWSLAVSARCHLLSPTIIFRRRRLSAAASVIQL